MPNPLHYPSLDLCQKLTEIGFLQTQYRTDGNMIFDDTFAFDFSKLYVCPSVMEMIDYIRDTFHPDYDEAHTLWEGLPDYLAEKILFLEQYEKEMFEE